MNNEPNTISTATLVWLATALLHKERKEAEAFESSEIFEKVKSLDLSSVSDSTIKMHISLHCVSNAQSQPDTHKKLFRIARGWYRLYREGDLFHPSRAQGRVLPIAEELPSKYRHLIEWYNDDYSKKQTQPAQPNNAIFVNIENNKTIMLPNEIAEFLQVEDGDYIAFITKSTDEVVIKKARMKLEI
ncbi:MAG: hypothetical protein KGI27_03110 [Thaumarchaeota archaeon]|nr:hypothetical protein [Nitrososphaerota archaeon]